LSVKLLVRLGGDPFLPQSLAGKGQDELVVGSGRGGATQGGLQLQHFYIDISGLLGSCRTEFLLEEFQHLLFLCWIH
jgi:hypothetical protein